jgi:outer membrane immunogenic protein
MRRTMFGAVAGIVCIASIASAADLPVKAPPPPAPAFIPFSWTGWYIGASGGYGWNDRDVHTAVTSASCVLLAPACQLSPSIADITAATVPSVFNTHPKGFIAGGQIGYNYQVGGIVWGVEADFSGADIKGSDTQSATRTTPPFVPISITGTADQRLDFFGTVRGRVGFTPVNPLLVFATGGLAYGHVSSSTFLSEAAGTSGGTAFGQSTSTRAGWTAGGGLEWMFAPSWSLKVEYLHYDLGNVTYALTPLTTVTATGAPFTIVGVSSTADFKGNIARVGLNYKID